MKNSGWNKNQIKKEIALALIFSFLCTYCISMKLNSIFLTAVLLIITSDSLKAQRSYYHTSHARQAINLLSDEDDEMEEDTVRGFSFGLNLGAYFASKSTGNFYNGSGTVSGFIDEGQEIRAYSIEERIGASSPFIQDYQHILSYYGASSYFFPRDAYPLDMRYNPTFLIGLQLKYNFNRYASVVANINAAKLKAVSQFTMQFQGTQMPVNSQGDVRLFSIVGHEQRFNINLGYRQGWMMGDFSNFYIQLGGSMLGTQFQKNEVYVAERNYNLFVGAYNPNQQLANVQPRTDIGFGAYGSTGVEFWLGRYSFDVSFGLSRDRVILYTWDKLVWNKWVQASFTI